MAAEIESIAYRNAPPWHGIGFNIQEIVSPNEMLKTAGLNWTVSKRPMFTASSSKFINEPVSYDLLVPDMYALVRDSDSKILGVCGPKYQPFQNTEVFDFFNRFTEAGHMHMEVAGSLKGGTWVWALAKLGDGTFNLMGDDENYSYLLLVSPHIWSEAMTIMFTSVRVVCWNTLTQALGKKLIEKFRFIHNRSFSDIKDVAEAAVEQAMINKMVYEQKAKLLSETKIVDMTKLYEYIVRVMNPSVTRRVPKDQTNPATFDVRTTGQILLNFHTAPGSKLATSRETWWGAYNAVTYFFDHQYGRSGPEQRLYKSWLSHINAVKKRKAFDFAVEYAQAA
jgi:phage/plasmid-like protein (TIGR03299 family)